MTARVLITGARAPVAVDLARAFRAARCTVHLADSVTAWAARGVRPRFPVHRVPPPVRAFPAFRAALHGLIESLRIDLVVPTCEEVFWLAAAAARDGWSRRLFAPDLARLRQLHSKAEFAAFAGSLGLAAPQTIVLDAPPDPATLPFALDELVLKPEFSRFATHTMVAPRAGQLVGIAPTPARRWVAQRRVRGREVCTWAAVREGRVAAFAAYRPLRRHGLAAAYQLQAVTNVAVAEVTERVAAATGMTGHLSFDIIVDDAGRACPIECNPRAVSGLHLFDADANLALALLGERRIAAPAADRLRHLGPAMAVLGLPSALRTRDLGAFLGDWRRSREVVGRGSTRVIAGCLVDAARFAATALWTRRSPAGATTADIEWDGTPIA